jgi:DeoR family transcriptional regulator, suf operon transcriptional repressor
MSVALSSDSNLLDMLRTVGPLGVAEMAHQIEVTPTAVRQRLGRLLAQGLIQRQPIRNGRGRPKHRYELTQLGLRLTGSNFTDLALAMWHEIEAIEDYNLRRVLLRGVLKALASEYSQQIEGRTVAEKMESLTKLLAERRVPFSVEDLEGIPVLTAHACPYPELAERDRTICALEKALFGELLGHDLKLTQCRLDGGPNCQFQTS